MATCLPVGVAIAQHIRQIVATAREKRRLPMADSITFQRIIYQGQARIQLNFPYRADWIAKVKSIAGRKWSQSRKSWHIPDTQESLEQLKTLFPYVQEQFSATVEDITSSKSSEKAVATAKKPDTPVT